MITKILEEYEKAINWYKSNQKDASELVVKTLPMLEVNGLADSIDYIKFENINAQNSKKDLEFFFSVLLENDSKIIGGKLPDDNFYYKYKRLEIKSQAFLFLLNLVRFKSLP